MEATTRTQEKFASIMENTRNGNHVDAVQAALKLSRWELALLMLEMATTDDMRAGEAFRLLSRAKAISLAKA